MEKKNRHQIIYKLKSIKSLMIIFFSMITTITMTITGFSLYRKFNLMVEAYASESVEQLTTQVQYNLNAYTKNMIAISNTLYYKIIKNQNITNNNFTTQMNTIQMTNNDIAGLAIFDANGDLVASSKYYKLKEGVDVTKQEWFESAIARPENTHFSSSHVQNLFEEHEPEIISLSTAVSLNKDGKIIQGVLLVDMNLTGIENICEPITDGDMGLIHIISPDGKIVYGDEDNISELEEFILDKEEGRYVKANGEDKYIITLKTVGYTGWRIIGSWQLNKVLFNFNELKNFLVSVILLGTLMCVLGTLYISSRLSSPLYKLRKSMKLVESGRFDIQVDEGGEYIVSELSKTFNKMVNRIKELMDEVVTQQDEKRKQELEALQSQINPHFLYNTLDSIIWLAENERVEDSILMTTALSRFFRIGISSGRSIISVREELEHAKNYLSIQKIRYKNKFEYKINVSDELLNARTIKLILQPIIENALYHGIEYMYDLGEIEIDVRQEGEKLVYILKDNGVGMTEETRATLFDRDKKLKSKGSGVGVRNVNERIKLYYGKEYGMKVESVLEEGTTIYIEIPLQYE